MNRGCCPSAQGLSAHCRREAHVCALGGERRLPARWRSGPRPFRDHHAAPQCDRRPAPGTRTHDHGSRTCSAAGVACAATPPLWLPGLDHAGIATQNVVEAELAREGLSRHDLGREAFIARVWDWVGRYRGRIEEQLRLLGASCDWSRMVFTLDEGPQRAVRATFVDLYEAGKVYRGHRIINWCPRCQTAISDLEVDYEGRARRALVRALSRCGRGRGDCHRDHAARDDRRGRGGCRASRRRALVIARRHRSPAPPPRLRSHPAGRR